MDYWLRLTVLLGILDLQRVACLSVTDISVPEIVDFRDNVTLACSYDMRGHTLNSVKWYKGEMEFFRYSPMMHPVYLRFPVGGVQVLDGKNFCNESMCRVELSLHGINSSGVYRCEVSGDAPHFKLTARSANMTVAALPQNNPLISNFKSMYREDEFVSANCSSDYASLPVQLSWLINDVQASAYMDLLGSVETTIPAHAYQLRRQSLPLAFYANDPRFASSGRHLHLKCVADIEKFPELRRETALRALLVHADEDLSNQKLVNSGADDIKTRGKREFFTLLFLSIVTMAFAGCLKRLLVSKSGDHNRSTLSGFGGDQFTQDVPSCPRVAVKATFSASKM